MAEPIGVDLSKGGVVTLLLGKGYQCPTEFAFHGQVHQVDTATVDPNHEGWIPSTTRIVVFTDHIPDKVYQYMMATCRQRRVPYLNRKTPGAVAVELQKLFPVKKAEGNGNGNGHAKAQEVVPETKQAKGSVKDFVLKHADLTKGSAEEGRRVYRMAVADGVTTTLASVTQIISKEKRTTGRGDIPVSAVPQGAGLQVYAGITTAIEALTAIRAHAETLEKDKADVLAENAELKARIQLMRDAWAGMK